MKKAIKCKNCGAEVFVYKNPIPAVDIIIHNDYKEVVLIERKNPPLGWALPGGFVDYGETIEEAAIREAKEETSLEIVLERVLGIYSHPKRDPRQHTISVVFIAKPKDFSALKGSDDAKVAKLFPLNNLPNLVFDHSTILEDFKKIINNEKIDKISFGKSLFFSVFNKFNDIKK